MKKRCMFSALIVLLAGAFASKGFAQTKLGYVNSQDVLEKSTEGKKIMARLNEAEKQNQAKVSNLDDQIRKLQTELGTQRITMTEEAIMAKTADLDRKNMERKRTAEDAYANMTELRDKLFKKLQDELVLIVEQIGKEKGYDFIFDLGRSGAVYWNPAIDLTADVIKKYDASKAAAK
ncbi:MAG: OmpH family outer membrane protein [Candidatus Aminicenantes bacterium]|nr:OmpH family outer membrane protein [Candidatus Aminicenantes bacterium]